MNSGIIKYLNRFSFCFSPSSRFSLRISATPRRAYCFFQRWNAGSQMPSRRQITFKIGDLEKVGPEENCQIAGRLTERHKCAGNGIYPRELQRVLEAHPAVAAAVIVASPDREWQERGHAFIQMSGAEFASAVDMEL